MFLSNLKSGEVYSPVDIQSNISKLEGSLLALGFEFIRIKPVLTRNISSLTIDIDFVFEKSDKLFIERIDISGNTATLDRVIIDDVEYTYSEPLGGWPKGSETVVKSGSVVKAYKTMMTDED